MKVKNLILALGVTGAFVACSQEELVNESQNLGGNRPVVGAIDVKIDKGVESRWAYAGGFSFDENDYMGACLMDVVGDLSKPTWAEKYALVNTISTNYKYGYKDNWTNGDAIMSEGNYFFYLPYNASLKGRSGLTYNLATDQYAYDKNAATPTHDGNKSWIDNQMFIGYDDIKSGDQQATPNLMEVFAKPRFNVNYLGSKNVVIERIVVLNETDKFAVKGQLDIDDKFTGEEVYNALSGSTNTSYIVGDKKGTKYTAADIFAMYNKAVADVASGDLELGENEKLVSPLAAKGLVSATTESASISLNVVPAKEVSALMVMPAGTQDADNMTIQIYTNVGWVVIEGAKDDLTKAADDTKLTYKNIDKLHALKAGDGVKKDAVEINFSDEDIDVPEEVTVATTAQLESVMRWYATTTEDFELTVNLASNDVQLTEKVYDIIKGNEELTVVFKGYKLTIPATAAADAWSTISLDETTSTIVNNAVLNISNTAAMTIAYPITNNGTINVTAADADKKKINFIATVTNNGNVNVKGGLVVYGTFTNKKNLTVDAGVTFNATTLKNDANVTTTSGYTSYANEALITNNGTMYFGGENQVTIENNGKIYLNSAFTNSYLAATSNVTNGYEGVINNNLQTSYLLANAAVTNNSKIINYGFVYSQSTGSISNAKYIKANDGSTTYVSTNTAKGEIELEKRDTETTVNDDLGLISYTLTAADLTNGAFKFDATNDKFNTLRVGMNMKLATGSDAPQSLIMSGATVSCPTVLGGTAKITAPKFASIKAESGVNVIKGINVEAGKLEVSAGALFQIPSLSTFGVSQADAVTVAKTGEILVGGTFNANNSGTAPTVGIFSKAGDGSYVWKWDGTTWK